MTRLYFHFDDKDDARVLVVRRDQAVAPVFLKVDKVEKFSIRTGPSSTELAPS